MYMYVYVCVYIYIYIYIYMHSAFTTLDGVPGRDRSASEPVAWSEFFKPIRALRTTLAACQKWAKGF